ncbi:class I SAM-dependent methyltransferase [Glycomyces sp. NPDC049804]|uniref:class I SAM-dependent methyltransferase n=1 Tax=Glycomyces sp. NPDC049804 TaxID=3154363 RepID=UPI0034448A9D
MRAFEFPGQYYEVIRGTLRDVHAETAYLADWLAKSGKTTGGRVLDLGCGTGTTLRALAARGHGGVGVDASATFIAWAAEAGGDGLEYVRADLTDLDVAEFATEEPFDLVVCLFATLNMVPPEALVPLLRQVRGRLAPGGHLVLDAAHLLGFVDTYQPSMIAHHQRDGVLLTRMVHTSVNGHTACWRNEETILARDPDGAVSMHENGFDQWVLTAPQIRGALAAAGFRVVAEHGGFRDAPPPPFGKGPLVQVAALDG